MTDQHAVEPVIAELKHVQRMLAGLARRLATTRKHLGTQFDWLGPFQRRAVERLIHVWTRSGVWRLASGVCHRSDVSVGNSVFRCILHKGDIPMLLLGRCSRLVRNISKARISLTLVCLGSITSSTRPSSAAR